jgi:hypothetical protein
VNPGVSDSCDWVTVTRQIRPYEVSTVEASIDREKRRFSITTSNIAELVVTLSDVLGDDAPFSVEIDGKTIEAISRNDSKAWQGKCVLSRAGDEWSTLGSASATRPGLFKSAFGNRAILVYGTGGDDSCDAALAAKARFDAETFWYRGNGDFRVMSDAAYLQHRGGTPEVESQGAAPGSRFDNVILYGNADTNAAWTAVLGEVPPVTVRNGSVRIGDRTLEGDSLACLFLAPMQGDAAAMVGVISGTGPAGAKLAERLPIFVSGVGIPGWVVLSTDLLTKGVPGVKGAGFFGPGLDPATGGGVWAE